MNEVKFYSARDPKGAQGFRTIQTTDSVHPYMKAWWPAGHIIRYERTFVNLIYNFMEAIAKDKMLTPNFVDGLWCQEVLEAVDRSIEEGRWVSLNKR